MGSVRNLVFYKAKTCNGRANNRSICLLAQCLYTTDKRVPVSWFRLVDRLVPHVDKAPLPLRILRLVTSNFLPVENPTHPTAHAPERASVYILGQFRTSK